MGRAPRGTGHERAVAEGPGFGMHPTSAPWPPGVFQCGPASVIAIREGNVDWDFDMPFIFAEVNADRITWIYESNGALKKNSSDTHSVGKYISTKAVGSNSRMDVTEKYKYPEGRRGLDGLCHPGPDGGKTALRREKENLLMLLLLSQPAVPEC